ncbi:ATP-binding protein [Paractinoplanes rhizophilus]|uniref:ATP-binding protein n=1 Tax=Paractinoplanes rhizophilus TaxID=1416877 RepID=A0ABW2HJD5_9ACTN
MDALRLPFSDAGESARIRRSAAQLLTGQPPDLVEDVLLVITELVDNVVQHTDGGGELRVWRDDGMVWVEVYDRSRVFPRLQRRDPRRPGGRGLLLVAALTEMWGSRPTETGKLVWARLGAPG